MRPKGWKNPYPKEGRALPENIPWFVINKLFEAGADAMLEGLKATGFYGVYSEGEDEDPVNASVHIVSMETQQNMLEAGYVPVVSLTCTCSGSSDGSTPNLATGVTRTESK